MKYVNYFSIKPENSTKEEHFKYRTVITTVNTVIKRRGGDGHNFLDFDLWEECESKV